MSYDKLTNAENRFHASRVSTKQKNIYLLYNDSKYLTTRVVGKFKKSKSMNCGCVTCKRWAQEAKASKFIYQLAKAG